MTRLDDGVGDVWQPAVERLDDDRKALQVRPGGWRFMMRGMNCEEGMGRMKEKLVDEREDEGESGEGADDARWWSQSPAGAAGRLEVCDARDGANE